MNGFNFIYLCKIICNSILSFGTTKEEISSVLTRDQFSENKNKNKIPEPLKV